MSKINSISTTSEELANKENNTTKVEQNKKVFCPWIKPDSKCHSCLGMLKLHCEILDFYHFIQLNEEEKKARIKTYNIIKNIIEENFPDYVCELYGSFRIGLSLPNSDIDILILPKEEKNGENKSNVYSNKNTYNSLKKIYDVFNKNDFTYIALIVAKVPIIKCTYKETNVQIDISMFKDNGSLAVKTFENIISIHPEIKPLMLLIKYILRQRHLNEIYKGGVSSFIIFTLLYYYIIDVNKRINYEVENGKKEKLLTLAHLLLGFFDFYGFEFNYKKLGILIRNGCFLYQRTDENKNILSVENFQDIYQDMGKNCYQYNKVIDLFKYASRCLTYYDSPVVSYLSAFIEPDDILKERNLKNN